MFVVPSTLQLLLAIALMLLGVSGNLAIPFVSYRSTLRCPHITVLAALDFTATLLGPGLMIVTLVTGPTWLEHSKTLCQSLIFLSSWVQIAGFLVLFFLAVFCQKVQHRVPGRRHPQKREVVFLAMSLLTGLLLSLPPFVGLSSYNGLPLMHSCILNYVQTFSSYSISYLACSLAVLLITIFLAVRALKHRRLYPVQFLWERHKYEVKMNDPEMTTVTSSSQSHVTSRSSRSYWSSWSRQSSLRSGIMSLVASPLASRKSSHQPRGQDSVLVEVLLRQANLNAKGLTTPEDKTNEEAEKETNVFLHPVTALEKNAEWRRPRSVSNLRDPYIISSGIPHNLPRQRVFQNPRLLPPFTALQQQRSLSRFLLMKSCVTILCWLPLCSTVVLQLCSVQYPKEVQALIQWLIFIPFSLSPLFPLCDLSYRLELRSVYSFLKTCATRNRTQTAESDDVEIKVEGSQQVRLVDVRPLQIQTLQ